MQTKTRWTVAAALSLLLIDTPAMALDISPFLSASVTFGGDTLGEDFVEDTLGEDDRSIKAGQFLYFALGATVGLSDDNAWETQASVGYWVDSAELQEQELRFQRYPVDLLLIRNFSDRWRIAGGVTRHLSPRRRCTKQACTVPDTGFEDARGFVVGVDWLVGGPVSRSPSADGPRPTKLWMGVRATRILYQGPESEGGEYNGDNAGFIIGMNFF
jgi:hypothetical protein